MIERHVIWTLPAAEVVLREWARVLRPGGRLALVGGRLALYRKSGLRATTVESLMDARLWGR